MSDGDREDELHEGELTAEERSEATALVDALERGTAREALPEDALETAALLRYSRDGGELGEDRRRAVLDDVWANAKRPDAQRKTSPGRRWWAWLVPLGGLGAAVGAALLFVTLRYDGASEPAQMASDVPVALPSPGAELLRAQAAVASGDSAASDRLGEEMRRHRQDVYAALGSRYGGGGR